MHRRLLYAIATVVAALVAVVVTGSALAAFGYHPLVGLIRPTAGHRAAAGSAKAKEKIAAAAGHQHGSLDTSFGRGGKVMTPALSHGAAALAIQQDGKLVTAGSGGGGFALVRYNANGSLDTSFGRGGIVTTPGSGAAAALVIQKDGKLVASGGERGAFALARYNANGSLDTSFGSGGKLTTPIGSGDGEADAVALVIQQDGKLVAAGGRNNDNKHDSDDVFVLVRYWP